MRRAIGLAGLLAILAGCGSNVVALPYAPTRAVATGAAGSATVGVVNDARRDNDPTWVGAVRGGYGNPLKVLRTGPPVAEVVRMAVADGLRARNLLAAGGGGPEIVVTIRQLSVSRLARLDANVELALEVRQPGGGVAYADAATVRSVQGSIIAFDTGVFASVEELRVLLARSLSEAVDQLLDKPALQAALSGTGRPRPTVRTTPAAAAAS